MTDVALSLICSHIEDYLRSRIKGPGVKVLVRLADYESEIGVAVSDDNLGYRVCHHIRWGEDKSINDMCKEFLHTLADLQNEKIKKLNEPTD